MMISTMSSTGKGSSKVVKDTPATIGMMLQNNNSPAGRMINNSRKFSLLSKPVNK